MHSYLLLGLFSLGIALGKSGLLWGTRKEEGGGGRLYVTRLIRGMLDEQMNE